MPDNNYNDPIMPIGLDDIKSGEVQGSITRPYKIQNEQKERFEAVEAYSKEFFNKEFFAKDEVEKKKNIETYAGMVAAWQQFYGAQAVIANKQSYGLSSHAGKFDEDGKLRFLRGRLSDENVFQSTSKDSGTSYAFKKYSLRSRSQRECSQLYQYAVERSGRDKLLTITCSLGKLHQPAGMLATVAGGASKPPNIRTFEGHDLVRLEGDSYVYNNAVETKLFQSKSFSSRLKETDSFSGFIRNAFSSGGLSKQIEIVEKLHRGADTIYQLAKMSSSSVMHAHAAIDIISEGLAEMEKLSKDDAQLGEQKLIEVLNKKKGLNVFKEGDKFKDEFIKALDPLIKRNGQEDTISSTFIRDGLMKEANIGPVPRALTELKEARANGGKPPVFHYGDQKITLDFQSLTGVHSDQPSANEKEVFETLKKYNKASVFETLKKYNKASGSDVENSSVVGGTIYDTSVFKVLNGAYNSWSWFNSSITDRSEVFRDVKYKLTQREQAIEVNNALKAIDEARKVVKLEAYEELAKKELIDKDIEKPTEAQITERAEKILDKRLEKMKQKVCEDLCKKGKNGFKGFKDVNENDVIEDGDTNLKDILSGAKDKISKAADKAKLAQKSLDSYKPEVKADEKQIELEVRGKTNV